jgi:hypothetical protein
MISSDRTDQFSPNFNDSKKGFPALLGGKAFLPVKNQPTKIGRLLM